MKFIQKVLAKIVSTSKISIKQVYKVHRKVLNFMNPYFRPLYNLWDHKVMAGDREIPVRVFLPQEGKKFRILQRKSRPSAIPSKVLVFFHGGGWVTGNIESYTKICANMANQTGHTVVSVDYRLAPENPFPAGPEDCYQVVEEIFQELDSFNCRSDDLTLIGDSAGGNLAAVVSLMARDRGICIPGKQILIYPATYHDHSDSSPFESVHENGTDYILTSQQVQDYLDLYVPNEEDRLSPYFAPLLSEDLSDQPDTLVITAEFDPLRDEGESYGQSLKKFDNYVEIYRMKDALHGFFT
ncbi:MAG: alpha/beta hydrolase [Clostridiales bacterium]|nr:alpha/beta hydrolase [Clostridiales bacterium]